MILDLYELYVVLVLFHVCRIVWDRLVEQLKYGATVANNIRLLLVSFHKVNLHLFGITGPHIIVRLLFRSFERPDSFSSTPRVNIKLSAACALHGIHII